MDADLKRAFAVTKPVCDMVMIDPTPANINALMNLALDLKEDTLEKLQLFILFPIITHLQSNEITGKYDLQILLINAMKEVLQRVIHLQTYDLFIRIQLNLGQIAFDTKKPGMIGDVPEELKLTIMQTQTALMLNLEPAYRVKQIHLHSPLLAQAIFASVHMAKMERHRALRLAALESLMSLTCTHPQLTDANYMIANPVVEKAVVHMLACILPGVLSTLQDVAMCTDNPGHAIVLNALNIIHRILCMTMNNKHLVTKEITAEDFMRVLSISQSDKANVSGKVKSADIPKLTREWFDMAGEKLDVVVRSLIRLVSYEHYKVRKELAVLCYRVATECILCSRPSQCVWTR
ncbi:TELO2-interacting protein 1 homolog isoform X2 [Leptidea sinapis]|uniref:TELO2-interacting protein 1 homolog isoform X2 n=1 Tax=Leptidea sinapis TaxID=189913 RepID=UPI0021C43E27|nr:TELO2-interacting protein 1 homolog isoform X2 [Leptidea sinapis]